MSTSGPSTTSASAAPARDTAGTEIPWAFIDCPTDTLILLISHMLNLLIQHNDQVVLTPDALTRFHSRAAPGISVLEYLRRIVKYTNMEKIPLLSLLAYIDITCQHLPTFTLSSLTVHRFLIAGVCAGSKAQCDVFCTNSHYAKVGGIKVQELNALEREFLRVTQWNLCCNADLLQRYYTSLIRSHGGYTQAPEPKQRPFLSFPRSSSKPREETEEDMEEGLEEGGAEEDEGHGGEGDQNDDYEKYDVGGEGVAGPSGTRRSYGEHEPESSTSPSSLRRGRLRKTNSGGLDRRGRRLDGEGMEVDVDSGIPSPSTSSVPSSSRSSIRGRSASGRGQTLSLSYSDPRIAEPRLDKTTASGSPFSREKGSASTSPLSQFASNGDLAALSGNHAADSLGTAPISQQGTGGAEHEDDHGHQQNHLHLHNPGAHLLKAIGGMFHKKHHQTEKQADSALTARTGSQEAQSSDTNWQPRTRSPGRSDDPAGKANSTAADSSTQGWRSTSTQKPANQTPLGAPVAVSSGQLQDRVRSPRILQSPGLAKPVTPRVRTRDELSESDNQDLQAMPSLGGVGIAADEGNRRARVE